MTKEITDEEKSLLVESKIRTCILMQETIESYLLEETDLEIINQYQKDIEDYKSIINALQEFRKNMLE